METNISDSLTHFSSASQTKSDGFMADGDNATISIVVSLRPDGHSTRQERTQTAMDADNRVFVSGGRSVVNPTPESEGDKYMSSLKVHFSVVAVLFAAVLILMIIHLLLKKFHQGQRIEFCSCLRNHSKAQHRNNNNVNVAIIRRPNVVIPSYEPVAGKRNAVPLTKKSSTKL